MNKPKKGFRSILDENESQKGAFEHIINRPSLEKINSLQAYKAMSIFRDSFLPKEDRKLPPTVKADLWKTIHPTLKLAGHDSRLDHLVGVLAQIAESHVKPGSADALALKGKSAVLEDAWKIIEHAKQHGDDIAQKIAENLQLAIYEVMPPQNNLKQDNGVRLINTGGGQAK